MEEKLNIIYNEDCILTMQHMTEKCVDIVCTSPPYNMTKRPGGPRDRGKYDIYRDWKTNEEYINWTIEIFNLYDKIVKENGVVLYNLSYSVDNPSLQYLLLGELIKQTDWMIADTIIWKKTNSIPHPASYNRLYRVVEFVFVFCRKNELKTFNMNKKISKVGKNGQTYYEVIENYIEAKNNDGFNTLNKATFSSDLVYQLISKYVKENSIVYDNFMGTGSTAIGALKHNCHYIGSEISSSQVEYSKSRIENYIKNLGL